MFRRWKFAVIGLALMVLLPTGAAAAPSPTGPIYPGVYSGTTAQLQALIAHVPPPTPAQLALAKTLLARHAFEGSVTVDQTLAGRGNVDIHLGWGSITIHFTQQDIHDLWVTIAEAGFGAAAAVLCGPGGWIAVACAIAGAGIGWLVAEIIWYYIGYYVPTCGVHITYYYWQGKWYWGNC